MNNEEYTFAKASSFTGEEKFDIALKYITWCAKLQFVKLLSSDNLDHDEDVKARTTLASLTALLQCLSDDDHLIRAATELQLAQESPLWAMDLPNFSE